MTIFKKIIDKKIPSKILYEDELSIAFEDVSPQAPKHILLIPKKEISSMNEVKEEDQNLLGHLMLKASHIAKKEELESYRLVINTQAEAGQTVYHLHIHILGGRTMNWPPG